MVRYKLLLFTNGQFDAHLENQGSHLEYRKQLCWLELISLPEEHIILKEVKVSYLFSEVQNCCALPAPLFRKKQNEVYSC